MFRIGVHVGEVVEEADGDLMGNGVNIGDLARSFPVSKSEALSLS